MQSVPGLKKNSNSRLPALDVARLIAMLMMVEGHTMFALLDYNIINSGKWYWDLWTFLRGLTAPVFLMVSGAVHIFANKRNSEGILPNKTIKRRINICCILMVIGYLLQFPVKNIYDILFINQEGFYKLFAVNVLQMFAISLLLLNLLFKLTKNNSQLMIVSFILANIILIISPFSLATDWFNILPTFFASFLSMQHGTIFPILPFTAYLLLGAVVGCLIQRQDPEKRNDFIAKKIPLAALPYIIIGTILYHIYNSGGMPFIGDIPINPGTMFLRVGLTMLAIAISAWIYKYCSVFQKYENTISIFSKRALFIYVIHLLIIYGSPITIGLRYMFNDTDVLTALYCSLCVIFFTLLIVYIYEKTYKKEKFVLFYKYIIAALIIYMLFL